MCFQTTYEELKLPGGSVIAPSHFMLPDYLWGIETRVVSWGRVRYIRSFQTTYEELKLDYLDYVHDIQLSFQTTYEELKPASQRSKIPLPKPASRLPMRNWNYSTPIVRYDEEKSFQTTYEELKPSSFMEPWGLQGSFQTTYEELKHGPRE